MFCDTRSILAPAVLALSLSACANMPSMPTKAPWGSQAAAMDEAAVPEEQRASLNDAVAMLEAGKESEAVEVLLAVLEKHPDSRMARKLLDQVQMPPSAFLQGEFEPYTVKSGDTMSVLAQRSTGDAMLFYALSKHNDLSSPRSLTAGAVIELPKMADTPVEVADTDDLDAALEGGPERTAKVDIETEAEPVVPAPEETAAPADPEPVVVATLSAAAKAEKLETAKELRRRGLKQLSGGEVEAAVSTLRAAKSLAPGDAAIAEDLSRAERVLQAVRAHNG